MLTAFVLRAWTAIVKSGRWYWAALLESDKPIPLDKPGRHDK